MNFCVWITSRALKASPASPCLTLGLLNPAQAQDTKAAQQPSTPTPATPQQGWTPASLALAKYGPCPYGPTHRPRAWTGFGLAPRELPGAQGWHCPCGPAPAGWWDGPCPDGLTGAVPIWICPNCSFEVPICGTLTTALSMAPALHGWN